MKKAFIVLLTAILLTGLCACATDNDDNTLSAQEASYSWRIDELNSQKSELEQELSKATAEKDELEQELSKVSTEKVYLRADNDELKAKIDELNGKIGSYLEQLSEAEQAIDDLKDKAKMNLIAPVNGGKLYKYYDGYSELRIVGDDGTSEEIYKTPQQLIVSVAPDRNRVLISDFDAEGYAKLSLYDISSKKLQEIKADKLPISHSPVFVKWYSDRYFLFVEQLDHGTVTLGGTVYCYDTETGNYHQVVTTPDRLHQIMSFDIFGGETVFKIGIWEETMNFYETIYRTVSNDQISKAITSGKAITLS